MNRNTFSINVKYFFPLLQNLEIYFITHVHCKLAFLSAEMQSVHLRETLAVTSLFLAGHIKTSPDVDFNSTELQPL